MVEQLQVQGGKSKLCSALPKRPLEERIGPSALTEMAQGEDTRSPNNHEMKTAVAISRIGTS